MKPYSVLGLSDSTLTYSGYANQTRGILGSIARMPDFDVRLIGHNYFGMPMWVDHDASLLSSCPQNDCYELLPGGSMPYGQEKLATYISKYRPELLWTLLDTFMIYWLIDWQLAPAKLICYFPSDGTPLPRRDDKYNTVNLLKKAEFPICMSEYGRDQAVDAGVANCGHIPHAVDVRNFRMYAPEERKELRRQWSQKLGVDLTDKFVVGSVGRFQGRKMHPELIKSFRDFSRDRDAVLLIHADPKDPAGGAMGISIVDLIHELKLQDKVFFTGTQVDYGFGEAEMGRLYNVFDMFALATSGEGFGIPTIEAMACGVPCVVTDYTTTKELVLDTGAGLAAKVADTIIGTYNVERAIADKRDMTEKLEILFRDENERKRMGRNGIDAVKKKYSWDVVIPQWEKAIREAVS